MLFNKVNKQRKQHHQRWEISSPKYHSDSNTIKNYNNIINQTKDSTRREKVKKTKITNNNKKKHTSKQAQTKRFFRSFISNENKVIVIIVDFLKNKKKQSFLKERYNNFQEDTKTKFLFIKDIVLYNNNKMMITRNVLWQLYLFFVRNNSQHVITLSQ